ncbi:MAG: prolyl oligopeptidase family serine peptidase [Rubrivivax sp.]
MRWAVDRAGRTLAVAALGVMAMGDGAFAQAAADELQWLEPPQSARALAWARTATERSTAALQASPRYKPLLDELTQLNRSAGQVASITLAGAQAVRLHKTAEHPKGLLQTAARQANGLGPWRTMLDVGALGRQAGKDFELHWQASACLAPSRTRCLLSLHEAGGDESELREFDLATGRFVEGGFRVAKSRSMAVWVDADTLLLGHTLGDTPRTMTGWPAQAVLWRRGTQLAEAKAVLRLEPKHALFMPVDAGAGGQAVLAQAIDYSTFALHRVTADGQVRALPLPPKLKMAFAANATHLFAQLAAPAERDGRTVPADSVVAVPLAGDGKFEVVYAARPREVVDTFDSFQVSRDAVALPLRSGLALRVDLARREAEGWRATNLVSAEPGVTPAVDSGDAEGDAFVVMRNGFLVPPVQELVRTTGQRTVLDAGAPALDASALQVELRQARSRDGQAIEYFVVGPRVRKPGPVPTLMTGYGAFGISVSPAYFTTMMGGLYGGATLKQWLDRGGALVVPAIRGGGEQGAAWHQAAMREKRQTSYDDFHAVAQALIDSGYTARKHLGVFGMSNGGLLAAVAGTQRPDLYGAVVSDVPLADMLRFPEMGMGAAWINEYGDPKDPQAAAWLRAYSPVHNVKKGADHPAYLVTVATTDNRVGPGHARKLAHRLMDVGAPVHFLEPEGGGHGVSDPLQRPDMMAKRITFLMDTLMGAGQ